MERASEETVTFRTRVENLMVFLVIKGASFILWAEIDTQDEFLVKEVS